MRKQALFLSLLVFFSGIHAFAQVSSAGTALGPDKQKIVQMAKAGVEDTVLIAYIHSVSSPFNISADDILSLKSAGVSLPVIAEILKHDAALSGQVPVTNGTIASSQLFRMAYGRLFFQGREYSYWNGLDDNIEKILKKDPAVQSYLQSYSDQLSASRILGVTGLSMVVGGGIYGLATAAQDYSNTRLNNGIALGVVGAGLLMAVLGPIFNHAAYSNLYEGLTQYNQDQLTPNQRR